MDRGCPGSRCGAGRPDLRRGLRLDHLLAEADKLRRALVELGDPDPDRSSASKAPSPLTSPLSRAQEAREFGDRRPRAWARVAEDASALRPIAIIERDVATRFGGVI
jgi:hypothetical protein